MLTLLVDTEADGINPTKVHFCVVKELETGVVLPFTDRDLFLEYVDAINKEHKTVLWVFHNGIGYDIPKVLRKLWSVDIPNKNVIDTFVVSRLRNYKKYSTHSLKELGEALGVSKGEYKGNWEEATPEMLDYCIQDVEVLESIYLDNKDFIFDTKNKNALRTEHDIAFLCQEMHENGFPFDKSDAELMLSEITGEMNLLESSFQSIIGNKRVEDRRVKYRKNKDGSVNSRVQSILDTEDCEVVGDEVIVYKNKEFNPGSSRQKIDVLWEYGWRPTEKTSGHKKHLRSK